jgi:autotransporter-associated beta strand protein
MRMEATFKIGLPMAVACLLVGNVGLAQSLYWDVNGALAGSGGPAPTGSWDGVSANWNLNSSGTGTTTAWVAGDTAMFSAGTDATGNYAVTLTGTQTVGGLSFASGIATLTGGTLTLGGAAGTVSVNSPPVKGVIASTIAGSVGLTKLNSGELVLAAANSFGGNLVIQQGTVTLNNSAAASSGTIMLNPANSTSTASLSSSNAAITIGNNLSFGGAGLGTGQIVPLTNTVMTLSGVISGSHNWLVNGPGTVVLSGANTFPTALTVAQGTVVVTVDGALGTTANGTVVNSGATLALGGGMTYWTDELVTLNGVGVGGNGAFQGRGGVNTFWGTVLLGGDTTMGAQAGSELIISTPLTGSGAANLTITNAGTVALAGDGNAYSNTLVAAGTLEVDDPANAGIGVVTVNAGAGLTGSGSAPGSVNLSGTIAPAGMFSSGAQTWNPGGAYVWEIADAADAAVNDLLDISGGLTNNATTAKPFTISIVSLDPNTGYPGVPGNFDNTQQYDWVIATTGAGVSGNGAANLAINANQFAASLGGGSFRLLAVDKNLVLEFDPAPVISCPGTITQGNDLDQCSASVSFAATATNYPNISPVTISYATNGVQITSPCVFPVGTTTVNALATDQVGDTAACTFTVTVNDTQAPKVVTQSATKTLDANGNVTLSAGDINNNSYDNCSGILSLLISKSSSGPWSPTLSYGCSDVGPQTVYLQATDVAGNSAVGSAQVTIQDITAPTALAKSIDVNLSAGNPGTVTVQAADIDNGSSDNCHIAQYLISKDGGANYAASVTFDCGAATAGAQPVTLKVVDGSGNSSTATATVTVQDKTAPSIVNCPANIYVTDPTGNGQSVTWTAPTATDNCSANLTSNHQSGEMFPDGTTTVTYTATDPSNNKSTASFTVTVVLTTSTYVDAKYAGLSTGTAVIWPLNSGTGTHYIGYDTFATIQQGVNAVAAGGTVNVAAGTYSEEVSISQPLALVGPNATVNPNTGARLPEAVILPDQSDPDIYDQNPVVGINIAASHVSIKGFTVDGYNPGLTTDVFKSGADMFNAAVGIGDYNADNSVTIENNIVKNDAYSGIDFEAPGSTSTPATDIHINCNRVKNMDYNAEGFGIGITLYHNEYAEITGNCLTNVAIGISPQWVYSANPGGAECQMISSNTIYASLLGVWLNLVYDSASTFIISNNTSTFILTNGSQLYSPAEWDAFELTSIQGVNVLVTNNTVIGTTATVGYNTVGYNVWNTPTPGLVIGGGSLNNVTYGVWVNDYDGYVSAADALTAATITGITISGSQTGIYVQDDPQAVGNGGYAVQATITGNTLINGASTGVLVQGTTAVVNLFDNTVANVGNAVGVQVDTGKALLQNNNLTGNSVAAIVATNGASVDAGDCGANLTGLGLSSGGNTLTGYLSGSPYAIVNNASTVDAFGNDFGATAVAPAITNALSGAIAASQSGGLFALPPPAVTVQCPGEIPNSVTTLADFISLGGVVSATAGVTVSPSDSAHPAANGLVTRTYTLTPACGNGATPVQSITVQETTPPTVVVKSTLVASLSTGSPGTVTVNAKDIDNGSSSYCGGTLQYAISESQSGPWTASLTYDCSQTGPYALYLRVTDAGGLTSTSTTATAVKVQDVTPPTLVFNSISVQLDANGNYTLTPSDIAAIAAGSSDNCSIASTSVTPSSFTFCDIGSKTVTLTLKDPSGNVTTQNGSITVQSPANPPSVVYVDASYGTSCGPVSFPNTAGTGTYYVGYNAFSSVQAGVNAVAAGGTVHVAAGMYAEQVEIAKDLTLNGSGAATIIQSPATLPLSFSALGHTYKPIVYVHAAAAGSTVENLTVDGRAQGTANYEFVGVAYDEVSGTVQNVAVENIQDTTMDGVQSGHGIVGYAEASACTLTVTGCNVSGCQKNGIMMRGNNLTATVSGNTVVGSGAVDFIAQNGIEFAFGATGTIQDNTVSGFTYTPAQTPQDDACGILIYSGSATISHNSVTSCQYGVGLYNPLASMGAISDNDFSADVFGVNDYSDSPAVNVNVASNWWGDVSGPGNAALNPYGVGSGVVSVPGDSLVVAPWLGSGANTQAGVPGFYPNPTPTENPPAQLAFTTQPGGAALGSLLAPQPIVAIEDAFGNVTPWVTAPVAIAIQNNPTGNGVLTGTTSQTPVAGVATFSDLAITIDGGSGYTLAASVKNLPATISSAFDIGNPVPAITSLSPAWAVAGDPGFTLTVNGANFVKDSMVRWNGSARDTTYMSPTEVTAAIASGDIASGPTASVTVFNTTPSGGESTPATTFNVYVVPPVVYVNSSYSSGGNNDGRRWGYDAFSTIQAGINRVALNGTVNVAAGTYNEAVAANKSVTLLGANHGLTACASRGAESIVSAGTGNALTITANNVVVDGFELNGAEAIQDHGYVGAAIQNNTMNAAAVGIDAMNIATADGAGFTVSNNCVTLTSQIAGTAPTIGVSLNGVTGPQPPLIQNNNVQGAFYGYMLYGLNASLPTLVQGGCITNIMQGVAVLNLNPATLSAYSSSSFGLNGLTISGFSGNYSNPNNNLHAGVYVYSGGSDPTARLTGTISDVTVTGTGKISPDSSGLDFADFSTATGVRQQLTVQNCNISTNENRGISCSGANLVASITGSTIFGNGFDPYGTGGNFGFGINVRNNSQVTVSNCLIANPATVTAPWTVRAVEADASTMPLGPTLVVTDCSIVNNGNPNGYLAGQSDGVLNASGNWWGTTSDTAIASLMLGVVDFTPYLDSGANTASSGFQGDFGTLHVTALGAQTGGTGRIQEGINDVIGGKVIIQAGNYVENILANQDNLELAGAGQALVTIVPALSAPNPVPGGGSLSAGSSQIILVQANDVSIHDLTLDGHNPALTSGISSGGVDLDARNGIIEDFNLGTFNGTTVYNTTVKNIYLRGIYASSGGVDFYFHDNTVQNVQADPASVAIFNDGGSGIISNNNVSGAADAISANWSAGTTFQNNTITDSGSGVHTDNSYGPDFLENNQVSTMQMGAYGVWVFAPYGNVTVSGNIISDCAVGLACAGQGNPVATPVFTGNTVTAGVDDGLGNGSIGLYETTSLFGYGYTGVAASMQNNVINGTVYGIYLEDLSANSLAATITGGNTVTGNQYGIYATGSPAMVKVENTDLRNNTVAAIQTQGGATLDAGQCGNDVTGLGDSAGGNNLTGYLGTGKAIVNLNANGTPAVLASQDSFGAILSAPSIASAFTGTVLASQSGGLLAQYPLAQNTECLSGVPVGATDLTNQTGFVTQGGAVSATAATVSFKDAVVSTTPNNRVITRTYTITDGCGQMASGNQIITVADTVAPVVITWPAAQTLDVGAACNAQVPLLTGGVVATDNCGQGNQITQIPAAGTLVSLGKTNVLVTVADQSGNAVSNIVVLTVIDTLSAPNDTYVDASYANMVAGTVVTWPASGGTGPHYVGCDAFATIQGGINTVGSGGTVHVAAGTYSEEVSIHQPLALVGPNATVNPNTGTRVAEAVIRPDKNGPEMLNYVNGQPQYNPPYNPDAVNIITIDAANVSIQGFTVDGYNPGLTGAWQSGSDSFNAAVGIGDYNGDNFVVIENNIIKNDSYAGVDLESDVTDAPTVNSSIKCNRIENMDYNTEGFGQGIVLQNNYYAEITGNYLANVAMGMQLCNFNEANAGDTSGQTIADNNVSASLIGVWLNLVYDSASTFVISNNTSSFTLTNGSVLFGLTEWDAFELTSIQGVNVVVTNNTVNGTTAAVGYNTVGYNVWNTPTPGLVIGGGSVNNVTYGVWVNDYDGYVSAADALTAATITGITISGSQTGIYIQDDPQAGGNGGYAVQATITGNTLINGASTGVLVQGANASANIHDNTAITGNGVGIDVNGSVTLLQNNNLTGNTVAGIRAENGSTVDAGNCTGANVTGLGISTGGNDLSGYLTGAAKAIINANLSGLPLVLADHDNFGAASPADTIANALSGTVDYSQTPAVVAAPANQTVTCASGAPVGVKSLADFQTAHGYFSASAANVSFNDVYSLSGAQYGYATNLGSGTITRTYTVTDSCGIANTCTQIITVANAVAPTLTVTPPANMPLAADPGQCSKSGVTWTASAVDNCGSPVLVVSIPSIGSSFPVGTTAVTNIATDASGNTATNIFTVTVVDTQPPTFITKALSETIGADAVTGKAALPDLTLQTVATDNCGGTNGVTLSQIPAAGTLVGLGASSVTVWATDQAKNSNSYTATITVVYTNAPAVTFMANVTVTTLQDKDPYATGYPTSTDPDGPVTFTYNDDRSGLNHCDSTGVILRTWTATDASGNVSNSVQTITVIDTSAPCFTSLPGDITTKNDPGQCGAVVNYTLTAADPGYFQGFENPYWLSGNSEQQPSTDWNEYDSQVTRVASGTDGITSRSGLGHGVINSTAALVDDATGAFSRLGGYSSVFGTGYRVAQDVYIDLQDPSVTSATASSGYAWDLSAAANDQTGNNLRDFIFHAAAYSAAGVVIAADNNSADSVLPHYDYRTAANTATITTSGWYTFQWVFRNTNDVLAVDLSVSDASGVVLFTQTLSSATDLISTVVGGHRYLWFTFINADKLAIDNTTFERIVPVTPMTSGTQFPVGATIVTSTATDACGNSTNTSFTVTVQDVEPPVIQPIADIVVTNSFGNCTMPVTYAAPVITDNCGMQSTNFTPATGSSFPVGVTPVTVVATDIHQNNSTSTFNVKVVDSTETSVATTLTPVTYGNSVTFTATVAACATLVPTGTVTFEDGKTVLGTVTLDGTATATFETANLIAGTHQITAIYAGDTNHVGSTSSTLSQVVNQATLTVTGITANNKIYNGNNAATLNLGGATLNGVVPGDNVTLVTSYAAGVFGDANAGSGKPVTISGLTVVGSATGNYTLTQPTAAASIIAAPLAVTANDTNRVYGTTNPVFTASYTGFVNGENVSVVSGAPDLSCAVATNAPVGVYANVIVVELGSLWATNYSFPSELFTNGTLTVAVAALKPSIAASDKVYDSTTSVSLTASNLAGVLPGDAVTLQVGSAGFGDKTVGTGKTVTASGLTLGGANAADYILSATTATTTASITAASLTVKATAEDKTYDGTAVETSITLTDTPYGADVVTASYTSAQFSDRNAGVSKTVTVSGIALGGTDAGNYALANPTATAIATIQPLPITVTAAMDTKQYDGTVTSTAVPTISPALVGGDTSGFIESFDTSLAGTGKTLTPSGSVLDGNNGQNYTVTFTSNNTGVIYQAPLSVTANSASKIYGATVTFAGTEFTVSGMTYGLDHVSSVTLASAGAVSTAAVGGYPITPSNATGTGVNNYNIDYQNGTLTVGQATPVLANLSATAIRYSLPLSAVDTLTGTAGNTNNNGNVPGKFAFASPASVPVATALQTVTFTPDDGADYTSATSNVSVTVIDPAIFAQPTDVTVALGSNATFTVTAAGSGTLSYQWQENGVDLPGETASNLVLNGVTDSEGGEYTVTVSNSNGFTNSLSATLTITHPPSFVTQPANLVVNQGGTATFTVSVDGAIPFTYQWFKNGGSLTDGGNISGATAKKLIISNVTSNDAASYSVRVANPDGTNTSLSATLTVIVPPAITSQPVGLTNNAGTTAIFSVTNTGSASAYYWYENGTNLLTDGGKISGSATPVLTIANVLGADSAAYDVVISNAAAMVTSTNAQLVVIDPIITILPVSRTNNLGTSASFTVAAYGTSPQYQWQKNGGPIAGATSPIYNLASVADTDAAAYSVVVSNSFGVVTSAPPAVLTVIDPPVITLEPASRTNNAGTVATFTVIASGTSLGYQWLKNGLPLTDGGNVSGSTTATLILANVQDQDQAGYTVILTNILNVVTSSPAATLTVIDAPVITQAPASRTNNAGTTATFTVAFTGTSPSYQWYRNGNILTNGNNVSGATTGVLTLTSVQDADATNGSYTVTLSNAAGTATSTPAAILTVIDAPVITQEPASCTNNAGTTATFTVNSTGTSPNYQWYRDGTQLNNGGNVAGATTATLTLTGVKDADATSGGYTVILSNAAGSVTSAPPARLTVIDPPVITLQPASLTNNAGTIATFTVAASGTSPSYQWYKNGTNALVTAGNVYGATSATLTLSNVFGIDGAIYSVAVSNAAAMQLSGNATLTVIDPIIATQPVGVTNIEGSTVVFAVTAIGTTPMSYQWYQDGDILDGETDRTLTLDGIADSDAGNYTVTITNSYGKVTSTPAILVTVPPLIVTQPANVVALVGDAVNFSVSVNGATPFSYQWFKNGTNVPTAVSRILLLNSVAVSDAGTYRVAVTNPNGTQMSDLATLSVYTSTVPVLTITGANPVATVKLTGVPTFTYAIQNSSDLIKWGSMQTNQSPFTISVTNSGIPRGNSFYRGVYLHE